MITKTMKLSPKTQSLIKKRMKLSGYDDPDVVVRLALQTLDEVEAEPVMTPDPETLAAIQRGLAQADRGEVKPWHEVRAALRALVG